MHSSYRVSRIVPVLYTDYFDPLHNDRDKNADWNIYLIALREIAVQGIATSRVSLYVFDNLAGYSSVRLERTVRDREVEGSNPFTPIHLSS